MWSLGLATLLVAAAGDAAAPERTAAPAPAGASSTATADPPATPSTSTFESASRGAVPAADLGTLLAPLSGRCDTEKREVDRIRCATVREHLGRVIPQRSYVVVAEDPAALTLSDYDDAIKGFRMSVSGCLACTQPVTLGRTGDKRLVTLKVPGKDGETLRAAVEVSRNTLAFEGPAEAKSWRDRNRKDLRVEFVFRIGALAQQEWTFRGDRGYALELLGARVFHRCSGEVLVSRPPSTGIARASDLDQGCSRQPEVAAETPQRPAATLAAGAAASAGSPSSTAAAGRTHLSKTDIAAAMDVIRPQVFACYEKFQVPGLAQLSYEVAGNGTVQTIRLAGVFDGTPTGTCVVDAARSARFPTFEGERQQFNYPFFLRR
jgi:hypothetical protein